jgi:hypothetical protein
MKKKKCPVPGCREKLTTINTYTCKACKQAVCLKHRLEGDHKCPGKAGAGIACCCGCCGDVVVGLLLQQWLQEGEVACW